jgi:colanic acid/amylovoran biosynthesis glycosyltransferase
MTLPLKRALGLPLVTTFYGYDMSVLPNQRKWQATYESLFEQGDAFLVEGHHMKARLQDLGCPEDKIIVQHIGVDLDKVSARPLESEQPSTITTLVCGSFLEKKGIKYAIEAFAKASNERPGMRMLIVGDGPERAEYEALIDRIGVGESVELLGYRTHEEYLKLAESAHIFMAPSVTASTGETEGGAPTVLLEMQAAGVPVISTYHADIPEVVIDGRSGFLVPERDSDGLAQRMIELADDPELRHKMGENGRLHVREAHDVARQAGRLEEIYLRYAN